MFNQAAATLSVDNSPKQNSIGLDSPPRGCPFNRRISDPLVSGGSAEADNERSPASSLIGAPPPEPWLRRRYSVPRFTAGLILYFISIGLVATATIVVFFGVAFLLLLQPAGGMLRSTNSPKPIAESESPIHGLSSSWDNFQRPTSGEFEPAVFRSSLPGSGAATASSIIPVVPRPAVEEALPLRPNDAAETNNAARSFVDTPVAEAVPQAEVAPPGREVLIEASTRSANGDFAAPPNAAPVSIAAPVHPGLSAADAADLLDRGDALLRIGDIASARLFYERAADVGNGRAALHLGASFDPAFLGRAGLNKMQADTAQAHFWYGRAVDLEVAEANRRLNSVDPKQGQ